MGSPYGVNTLCAPQSFPEPPGSNCADSSPSRNSFLSANLWGQVDMSDESAVTYKCAGACNACSACAAFNVVKSTSQYSSMKPNTAPYDRAVREGKNPVYLDPNKGTWACVMTSSNDVVNTQPGPSTPTTCTPLFFFFFLLHHPPHSLRQHRPFAARALNDA